MLHIRAMIKKVRHLGCWKLQNIKKKLTSTKISAKTQTRSKF